MKLLEYKQFNNSDEEKTLNKKKVTVAAIIVTIIVIIAIAVIAYISSAKVRNFMDKYLLFKSVSENDLAYINVDTENDIFTYAFCNYVVILENQKLTLYNSSGNKAETFDVKISSPIFASQDNYLVVAEKGQQKIYLIKDKKIVWSKDVEGQISRVNVNQSGYVSVIVSGTSYKSVIVTYSENGSEVFKTFLSNTVAVDVDISRDNKYLSFCEMDLSGTMIESKVKTISIDKAKQDPANAIIFTYDIPSNVLVTNLEYHEKDELLCLCDSQVYLLKDGRKEDLASLEDESITFCGIQLNKSYFRVKESINGINNQKSNIEIYNTSNHSTCNYEIDGIAKDVCSKEGVIAINLGSEIYFVNEMGWLVKKYTSSQEIRGVVVSDNIAGIIFRNKIEFLGL